MMERHMPVKSQPMLTQMKRYLELKENQCSVFYFFTKSLITAGTSPITWLKGDSAAVSNTLGVRGEGH